MNPNHWLLKRWLSHGALPLAALLATPPACRGARPAEDAPPGSKRLDSLLNAPPVASPEVCKEKWMQFAALRQPATVCETAHDCRATGALQMGKYNSSNCLAPLHWSRITPELLAAAKDYHNACSRGRRLCRRTWPKVACLQGRCSWDNGERAAETP